MWRFYATKFWTTNFANLRILRVMIRNDVRPKIRSPKFVNS
jgi:hypothetical protein